MSIEAMKQALEALEVAANGGGVNFYEYAKDLRQAIAEAEKQEPVAYMYESVCGNDFATRCAAPSYAKNIRPLYTTPQQRKPLTDEIPKGVLLAISNAGLTLLKTQHGYELRKLNPIEAAHGIKGEA